MLLHTILNNKLPLLYENDEENLPKSEDLKIQFDHAKYKLLSIRKGIQRADADEAELKDWGVSVGAYDANVFTVARTPDGKKFNEIRMNIWDRQNKYKLKEKEILKQLAQLQIKLGKKLTVKSWGMDNWRVIDSIGEVVAMLEKKTKWDSVRNKRRTIGYYYKHMGDVKTEIGPFKTSAAAVQAITQDHNWKSV